MGGGRNFFFRLCLFFGPLTPPGRDLGYRNGTCAFSKTDAVSFCVVNDSVYKPSEVFSVDPEDMPIFHKYADVQASPQKNSIVLIFGKMGNRSASFIEEVHFFLGRN